MRGEGVTDGAADGGASIIFPQAQNRMHLQKTVLLALIGIDELPADPELPPIGAALLAGRRAAPSGASTSAERV